MKYIKTFENYKPESELIEEGWKEWLAGGLIALSSVAGFYKLDQEAQEDTRAKVEYSTQINKTIDNMDEESVYNLITDFNSSDHGLTDPNIDTGDDFERPYGTDDDHHDKGDFRTSDDFFGTDSTGQANKVEFLKNNLKKKVQEDPSSFLISKDGKTVKLSPELQNTVNKW